MGDDGYNASELRQRYGRGGSVRDSDLSAAQLRARYAIPNNTFKEEQGSENTILILVVVLLIVGIGAAAFVFSK